MRRIVESETKLNGTAGMEATAAHLQRAIEALDEAAWYFERLGMDTQSEQLDAAQMRAKDVQDLLGVLVGTVSQADPFAAEPQRKNRAKRRAITKA